MEFNIPGFRAASSQIAGQSQTAATTVSQAVTANLVPIGGASPFEAATGVMAGQLQGVLSPKGPALGAAGTALDGKTQSALSAIDAQDATNAARFPNGSSPAAPPVPNTGAASQSGDAVTAAGDIAADAAGTADDVDPTSIDKEAREKAEQMLSGDQVAQQMGQMVGQAAQAASQAGQQLSQQFNQVGQQLGQGLQQAGQQLGQLVGRATQGLGGSIATPDLGLDSLGSDLAGGVPDLGGAGGGVPDFGGGAGDFGGGGGIGDGIGGDGAAGPGMTTSPALMPSPLTPPGTGSQNNSVTRVPMAAPMMPMMPLARGAQADNDNSTKRDPVIFAERPLYEPPEGVEQVIGARPEIESEKPPFGAGSTESDGR